MYTSVRTFLSYSNIKASTSSHKNPSLGLRNREQGGRNNTSVHFYCMKCVFSFRARYFYKCKHIFSSTAVANVKARTLCLYYMSLHKVLFTVHYSMNKDALPAHTDNSAPSLCHCSFQTTQCKTASFTSDVSSAS